MTYRKFEPEKYKSELKKIWREIQKLGKLNHGNLRAILHKYPKDGDKIFSKDQLVQGFHWLGIERLPSILTKRPVRSISGVTTVTVLTRPFPCPGKCIFCPNDITMPKSYIASEPGAQRALANRFDPYNQVYNRLKALHQIGHPTQKIELLVLGGTWSYYPESYQIWFINRCFEALNNFDPDKIDNEITDRRIVDYEKFNDNLRRQIGEKSYNALIKSDLYKERFERIIDPAVGSALWEELAEQQKSNESTHSRNVGLVLETRPDTLDEKEVLKLRKFGATKIQIGVQTLDPEVNKANKRFESVEQIKLAFGLLRQAGFKIHAHVMPNLYKSTPEKDLQTYHKLFNDLHYKPDELKIYPTSTIKHTELHELYQKGRYKPYTTKMLISLLAQMIEETPRYCRLSRIIRDIPSNDIEAGNKKTNLRQLVEDKLKKENRKNHNIRAREIRNNNFDPKKIKYKESKYDTNISTEYFLEYTTSDDKLLGFLRLSIPHKRTNSVTSELDDSAIIREIHVYGPAQNIESDTSNETNRAKKAQHIGLGTKLIMQAEQISKKHERAKVNVISAIGTRKYYQGRGFKNGTLYQYKKLSP
ncbi:tRNA uridine(34) 5-carboxymethylaminomethyl modification radical SAM/GNAT enzyme Elp3 [Candidatus Dojkabacteria bacterium]|nr:tRNA uridine(34) 5-carboxymethylaminomethyl modification radical SAM/GNAT enzyme Elp3 [Candidatus Dojkabacteria bacterium]